MQSKRVMAVVAMIFGFILFVSVGEAEASPTCTTGSKLAQYKTGKKLGAMIVDQAWLTVGEDPTRFDEVADAVRAAVSTAIDNLASSNPSDLVLCRAKGMAQGVCDALDGIQDGVEEICLLDGEAWGELSSELYCSLSIAFGGLDVVGLLPAAPVGVCGETFEDTCREVFTSLSSGDDECDDFTVAPFALVFAESEHNMCIFEIEE
jgi:hypothetical protein